MTDFDAKVAVATLQERIGAIDAKASAAHKRVDRLEEGVREDLKEMKQEFHHFSEEIKPVIAWMNRAKGWAAASVFIGGILGGGIVALIGLAVKFL